MKRPPKFVALHRPHWQVTILFPPRGFQVRAVANYWSPQFMEAYEAALSGQPSQMEPVIADQTRHYVSGDDWLLSRSILSNTRS